MKVIRSYSELTHYFSSLSLFHSFSCISVILNREHYTTNTSNSTAQLQIILKSVVDDIINHSSLFIVFLMLYNLFDNILYSVVLQLTDIPLPAKRLNFIAMTHPKNVI